MQIAELTYPFSDLIILLSTHNKKKISFIFDISAEFQQLP